MTTPALAQNLDVAIAEIKKNRDDLVTLTSWMADEGYAAKDIAYAVEKPHKYATELARAKAALEADS
jgi:murein tripeptide amidase MpaA